MRSSRVAVALVSTGLAALIAACGLVIDPDNLISANGIPDEGGTANDGNVVGDGSTDAPFIDPNCKPTGAEVCDDGIDNDCNGRIDCADPACGAFACIAPAPDGWAYLALAPATRPSCGDAFTTSSDKRVIEGSLTQTCKCNCGSPCGGDATIEKGSDNTCTSGTITVAADTNGGCNTLANADVAAFAKVVPPAAGSCGATDAMTKGDPKSGRTCTYVKPPRAQSGCAGAEVCATRPPDGYSACVAKDGANACPPGYAREFHVGGAVDDQRKCTGCTCSASVACAVEVELWTQPQCMGGSDTKVSSQTNGSCQPSTPVNNVKGYKSKLTGGACAQATASMPSGTITFTGGEQTVCCK